MSFPSPIGGTFYPIDFIPSLTFAILFGLLSPLAIYRAINRHSRSVLLIGTALSIHGHIVFFLLRGVTAASPEGPTMASLAAYMQVDLGLGYVGIACDLVNHLRCILVNSTFGSDTYQQSPEVESRTWLRRHKPEDVELPAGTPDHPRRRFLFRRFCEITTLSFLSAIVLGALGNMRYSTTISDTEMARMTALLRYASSAIALFSSLVVTAATVYARFLPRVNRSVAGILTMLGSLISVVGVYRLIVMENDTTALNSTAPGSQNTTVEKILFYILHVTPEWVVCATVFCLNMRQLVGSGIFGDWRWRDETYADRANRDARAAIRAEKRRIRRAMLEEDEETLLERKVPSPPVQARSATKHGLIYTQPSLSMV